MRGVSLVLPLIAVIAIQVSPANSTPVTFVGHLSSANEVPPSVSPGTGLATVILDTTAQTLELTVSFSGLTSLDTAAHIHCCVPLGANAEVATASPSFAGFPLDVTSGTFTQTFSLTDASFYSPTFVTDSGGTVAGAEAALELGIEGELTYFNINTVNDPGGEIRGQLLPVLVSVPEPASLALFGSALLSLAVVRRWRPSPAQSSPSSPRGF
jgi:hypothetical protein